MVSIFALNAYLKGFGLKTNGLWVEEIRQDSSAYNNSGKSSTTQPTASINEQQAADMIKNSNWRSMVKSGSRLEEAMKGADIFFPPALIEALQDSYDATHTYINKDVSRQAITLTCTNKKGKMEYYCDMPMVQISGEGSDEQACKQTFAAYKKTIEQAQESGVLTDKVQVKHNLKFYHSGIATNIEVVSDNLEDVMKSVCDLYLNKHAPQYAIDYKKIIETGIDERTAETVKTSWADRTQGEGKDGGRSVP